jgi:hypothetical protein
VSDPKPNDPTPADKKTDSKEPETKADGQANKRDRKEIHDKFSNPILAFIIERPALTNVLVGLLGLCFIALSVYLSHQSTQVKQIEILSYLTIKPLFIKGMSLFFKEVGFAFVVAVIVNMSIEAFNRRRHEKEREEIINEINSAHGLNQREQIRAINQKMFQTLFERNIPKRVFREIEAQLLKADFIRMKSRWQFRIEKHSDDFVKLYVSHTFFVRNITPHAHPLPFILGFDVVKGLENLYVVHKIKIGSNVKTGNQIVIRKNERTNSHAWWEVEHSDMVSSGATIPCEIEYERASPLHGKEVVCSLLPTHGMTVQVIDPYRKFALRGMSLHPRPEKDLSTIADDGISAWAIDGTLFPGQGFLFDWTPRALEEDGSAAADPSKPPPKDDPKPDQDPKAPGQEARSEPAQRDAVAVAVAVTVAPATAPIPPPETAP